MVYDAPVWTAHRRLEDGIQGAAEKLCAATEAFHARLDVDLAQAVLAVREAQQWTGGTFNMIRKPMDSQGVQYAFSRAGGKVTCTATYSLNGTEHSGTATASAPPDEITTVVCWGNPEDQMRKATEPGCLNCRNNPAHHRGTLVKYR